MDKSAIDELREWFEYEPETGILRWRKDRGRHHKAGAVAGNRVARGYVYISFGRHRLAHRIAWAIAHGAWPQLIDHINGDPADNRLANLRDATPSVNSQNQRRAQRRSSTGLLGVSPLEGKFGAFIHAGGRKRYLGLFDDPQAAHEAYLKAKRELHAGCSI